MNKILQITMKGLLLAYMLQLPMYGEGAEKHKHDKKGETCFICDPKLREKGRLWCKEHARYEDRCWLCHAELEDKSRMWCKEHSLYEDECFLCHPEVKKDKAGTAQKSGESCAKHNESKSLCFVCDPKLREKGRLWCKEHARYEDRCWLCHPEIRDEDREYCEEHYLYEDECIFCKPKTGKACNDGCASDTRKESPALFCNEHQVDEIECGICQPQLASELEPGQSMKVRMGSKDSASKAGVISEYPKEIDYKPSVPAYFDVHYNENAYARITPLAPGIIKDVLTDVGQDLSRGDPMAVIHSSQISDAKVDYFTALVDLDAKKKAFSREEKLAKEKISAYKNYQAAEAEYQKALLTESTTRQRLLNYGFSESELDHIVKVRDSTAQMLIRAPFNGTVVRRNAVAGEVIQEGSHLFSLAGLDTMWLDLSVSAENLPLLSRGLEVTAVFDGFANQKVRGEIEWVDSSVDMQSRMLKARAVTQNQDRSIKAGMFGHAEISISGEGKVLAVPKDAVQYYERKPYLFVEEEADLYALRRVRISPGSGDVVAVLDGLNESDRVVVARSFTMMSEFLKSRLGAGCVDD